MAVVDGFHPTALSQITRRVMPTATCDIGLIGLAVMGQNLVLNMNDHGYRVAVFNRTVSKVDEFLNNEAKGTPIVGAHSIPELAAALKTPRRVMLMVKAGDTVDHMRSEERRVGKECRSRWSP